MTLATEMTLPDPQIARSEIVRTFGLVRLYLILGVAITTVGVPAAGFSVLRRRLDPMLLWFALLAVVYGVHLAMEYQMLWDLRLGSLPLLMDRVVAFLAYVSLVPLFFFLERVGVPGRVGRPLALAVSPAFGFFALLTLAVGPRLSFDTIVNALVVGSFAVMLAVMFRSAAASREAALIRYGLVVFALTAFYNGTVGRHSLNNIEPFGFLVLLGALGVVAGRRTLEAFSFASYEARTEGLEAGDRLVLYTDGVLEAADAHAEEFVAERLRVLGARDGGACAGEGGGSGGGGGSGVGGGAG